MATTTKKTQQGAERLSVTLPGWLLSFPEFGLEGGGVLFGRFKLQDDTERREAVKFFD